MGQRSSALADQFEQAIAEFASVIEAIPDDKWTAAHGPEGWTLAATAQHVSGQFPLEMEYITAIAAGRPLPSYSWDDINGKNDSRATRNTAVTKAEVLRELREDGAATAAYLRGLSDDQLDRTAELALAGGAVVNTQALIEGGVLIDHVRGHLQSLRATG
jgi:uncharacterized damage-inducible protein DinB